MIEVLVEQGWNVVWDAPGFFMLDKENIRKVVLKEDGYTVTLDMSK